ncbi:MAG: hypothetical protein U9P14_12370 [Gemmatimonadota bacterium]|nr:hypothetical protein [Gemmatimonadota bacterium]
MKEILQWLCENSLSLITISISLIALFVSIWAFRKSHKTERRMLEIEERREEDRIRESGKAKINARLFAYNLEIENNGEAEARDVCVTIDGKSLLEHPAIPDNEKEISLIPAEGFIQYHFASVMGMTGPFKVVITWHDDSGGTQPRSFKAYLTPLR